jgi:hypothetical protein
MIHLRIHADKFEDYVCEPHHHGSQPHEFEQAHEDRRQQRHTHFLPGELHMNRLAIKVENSERTHTVYKLNMLEIEQSHLDIRKMNVQTCVSQ